VRKLILDQWYGSIREIRKSAFDTQDALVARLGQGDALRFQIADGDAETCSRAENPREAVRNGNGR
jgi:hypothetical protein